MAETKNVFLFVDTGTEEVDRDRYPKASKWKVIEGGALVVVHPDGTTSAYSPVGWRSLYTAEWQRPTWP
ncbi:hypothetical protein [Mycobacterium avium]|uniref:hypothetical protein n=1 Tax=Mycobacterium avium TaxID=1764 RepID=UPI001CC60B2F|nr:hypothetical protein [Mycobacterium avium]MBZ4537674.1 hypothetical protein [Mycobacterium avium subsp. hominissuis]MBZ4575528.1 hypothetical protein [Mycobacterium avium subsp. hominissuis]MBZ4580878.1 hypothetical protein [Mycobacterium avium subsp. hominissuis]MBZ4592722.1 hypothetical protein [Mycobacterium avium subsp. hominissuis]MBZ4608803.1 hypothetical protein [Mycobacterium avium subsp. hominissuis]